MKTKILLNLASTLLIVVLITGISYSQDITHDSPWHYINSPYGHISIGPANSSGAHIYTNMQRFFFNKPVWAITGEFSAYNNRDLKLQTAGITRMTIQRTNGNVGIGTAAPSYKLQVAGDVYASSGWVRVAGNRGLYFQSYGGGFRMSDNTWIRTYGNKSFYHNTGIMRTDGIFQVGPNGDRFTVLTDSKAGVGTTAPKGHLQVNDRLVINSPGTNYWGWIGNNSYWDNNDTAANNPKRVVSGPASEYTMTNDGDIMLRTAVTGNANTKINYKMNLIVKNNGGVGINTWDVPAGYELAVDGNVIAGEVKVKPANFWDEVFMENYDLMTMEEKQAFTQREHHLPSFEPEAVIVAEGMNVGESFADVAKELEEAHLYIFQLNDMVKELRKEINTLKEQIEK